MFQADASLIREQILANATVLFPAHNIEIVMGRNKSFKFSSGLKDAAIFADVVHKPAVPHQAPIVLIRGMRVASTGYAHSDPLDSLLDSLLDRTMELINALLAKANARVAAGTTE